MERAEEDVLRLKINQYHTEEVEEEEEEEHRVKAEEYMEATDKHLNLVNFFNN